MLFFMDTEVFYMFDCSMDHACDTFNCVADQEFELVCPQFTKGPADVDCHLPCLTGNCSVYYMYETICMQWNCEKIPGPVPPSPTPVQPTTSISTPTPGPTPNPMPADHITIIFSVGGKGSSINDVTQFWIFFEPPSPLRHKFYY